jgi:hypothetical protein
MVHLLFSVRIHCLATLYACLNEVHFFDTVRLIDPVPLGRLRDTDAGLATKHSTEHANNFKKIIGE